jgi:uncharacterized protein (DUF1778 family)
MKGDEMQTLSTVKPVKRESLNLRIQPEMRDLIDQAARMQGKNRPDFILEAAMRAAEAALVDRALIRLQPEDWDAFLSRLEKPPEANERLRRTMHTPSPWKAGA